MLEYNKNKLNTLLSIKTSFYYVFLNVLICKFVIGFLLKLKQLYIYINFYNLIIILTFLKLNFMCLFNTLLDIAVVDYPEKGNNRFELNYIFVNYIYEYRLIIKLNNNGILPITSIENLYLSSNWLEREAWDMFGIRFIFHSNLRRILTDYGFKGHPLRKDFPLVGYVDIYYNDSCQQISLSDVELSQIMRFYTFENPWRDLSNS